MRQNTTGDVLDTIAAAISKQIDSHISQLIASDASRHDKIAGQIQGLSSALKEVQAFTKKFRLGDMGEAA